jgi:hypothetical protein
MKLLFVLYPSYDGHPSPTLDMRQERRCRGVVTVVRPWWFKNHTWGYLDHGGLKTTVMRLWWFKNRGPLFFFFHSIRISMLVVSRGNPSEYYYQHIF